MHGLIVTGISTDVGKTITACILTTLLKAHYWKPVEAGGSDTETVRQLTDACCHQPAYQLTHPLSPHHAAKLENIELDPLSICPPKSDVPLVIEGCGGLMVPLNETSLFTDLFSAWKLPWVLVSKNYLGSINHTLLSIEWLKRYKQSLLGVIFNGPPNQETERVILSYSNSKCLGRVHPETHFTKRKIQWYATQFKPLWKEILTQFGTPSLSGS